MIELEDAKECKPACSVGRDCESCPDEDCKYGNAPLSWNNPEDFPASQRGE
jgi:hypothetical protein